VNNVNFISQKKGGGPHIFTLKSCSDNCRQYKWVAVTCYEHSGTW